RLVSPGEAAERAGLLANDVVLAVNGETITVSADLSNAIRKYPDRQISMSILRDGRPMTILATPANREGYGRLGVEIGNDTVHVKLSLLKAARMSIDQNLEYTGLIGQTLWGLVTLKTSPKELMGPVAMAQMSGESARLGLDVLFALMA